VNLQLLLSVSSTTSSREARDNSWYGNVPGGELKSPQMMIPQLQSTDKSSLLLLLMLSDDEEDDVDDDDDVSCTNSSSSLTASDA